MSKQTNSESQNGNQSINQSKEINLQQQNKTNNNIALQQNTSTSTISKQQNNDTLQQQNSSQYSENNHENQQDEQEEQQEQQQEVEQQQELSEEEQEKQSFEQKAPQMFLFIESAKHKFYIILLIKLMYIIPGLVLLYESTFLNLNYQNTCNILDQNYQQRKQQQVTLFFCGSDILEAIYDIVSILKCLNFRKKLRKFQQNQQHKEGNQYMGQGVLNEFFSTIQFSSKIHTYPGTYIEIAKAFDTHSKYCWQKILRITFWGLDYFGLVFGFGQLTKGKCQTIFLDVYIVASSMLFFILYIQSIIYCIVFLGRIIVYCAKNLYKQVVQKYEFNRFQKFLQQGGKLYKDIKNEINSDSCIICMGQYEENEKVFQLNCGGQHHFHPECLKVWLEKNPTCPVCRRQISQLNFKFGQQQQQENNNIPLFPQDTNVESQQQQQQQIQSQNQQLQQQTIQIQDEQQQQ